MWTDPTKRKNDLSLHVGLRLPVNRKILYIKKNNFFFELGIKKDYYYDFMRNKDCILHQIFMKDHNV